jgi:selenocysteine-specific elongation factor
VSIDHARKVLQLLLDSGELIAATKELLFHRNALDDTIKKIAEYAAQTPGRLIDIAVFKELTGISRKYAIPLLEYFDRERITRRAGDKRLVL